MKISSCFENPLQFRLELLKKLSGDVRFGRYESVDHDLIAIGNVAYRPESLVRLGKVCQTAKLRDQYLLQFIENTRFNGRPVVILERYEQVIFFHKR